MSDNSTYRLFRRAGKDQSLDWGIATNEKGEILIRKGFTGKNMSLISIPVEDTSESSKEVQSYINEKLHSGYIEIGTAVIKKGKFDFIDDKPLNNKIVHWAVLTPIEKGRLLPVLKDISDKINSIRSDVKSSFIHGQGLELTIYDRQWLFGYQMGGNILPTGIGGGKIEPSLGPLPLLVLLAVSRKLSSDIQYSNDAGERIYISLRDEFLFSSRLKQQVDEYADRLGIRVLVRFKEHQGSYATVF